VGYAFAALIWLVPLVAIAVWLCRAIWAPISLPKRAAKEPSCEKCRYPVAGLIEMRCPECGTDLRVTGIITREMEVRRRGSVAGAITALGVLWVLLYLIASGLGMSLAYGVFGGSPPGTALWIYVGVFVGWCSLGVGAAVWIVRRRRKLLARHAPDATTAAARWRVRSFTLAFVQWVFVWLGAGLVAVAPVCAIFAAWAHNLGDDGQLWISSGLFAVLWAVVGVWVGGKILARAKRERLENQPGAPAATPGAASADNPGG